jgi:hypothetical protein
MKQNITISQLDELSVEAREKLHKYLGLEIGSGLDWPAKYYQTVLLTIGEMIEFIDKHVEGLEIKGVRMTNSFLQNVQDNTMIWSIWGGKWSDIDHNPELCDALWEAVKEILESENAN